MGGGKGSLQYRADQSEGKSSGKRVYIQVVFKKKKTKAGLTHWESRCKTEFNSSLPEGTV
jgi:hypothetical protein